MGAVAALLALALLFQVHGLAPRSRDASFAAGADAVADGERDRVESLPGAELDFDLYAG